jgi:hypothetical protein
MSVILRIRALVIERFCGAGSVENLCMALGVHPSILILKIAVLITDAEIEIGGVTSDV